MVTYFRHSVTTCTSLPEPGNGHLSGLLTKPHNKIKAALSGFFYSLEPNNVRTTKSWIVDEQSLALMVEGLSIEITETGQYGKYFKAFDSAKFRVHLEQNVTDTPIKQLEQETLSTRDCSNRPYRTGFKNPCRFIPERIPSAIIGLVIGGLIAGIFCRQIFNAQLAGIPLWVWLAGGAAVLYLSVRSDTGRKATGTIVHAGKVCIR